MIFKRKTTCRAAGLASLTAQKSVCIGLFVCIALCSLLTGQVHADLANGSFEAPDTGPLPTARHIPQGFVPGWETTASTDFIEIWSNSFSGVTAYDGKQHAEVNADEVSTLYQQMSGVNAGLTVGFEFAHMARFGTDELKLTITDLGADDTLGGGNDTVLFTKNYSATDAGWIFNTSAGEPSIITLGNDIRFAYDAVSSGTGDLTQGNFIDAAKFTVSVPEPSAAAILFGIAGLGLCLRRRRKSMTPQRN